MKTIIFDFDGTLIDTSRPVILCLQQTFRENDLGEYTEEQCASVIGLPLYQCFAKYLQDEGLIERCCIYYEEHFPEVFEKCKVKLFPKVKETLAALKQRGCQLAIATSRCRKSFDEVFGYSKLEEYFSLTITPDEVEKGKPNPDSALKIMEILQVSPCETIMVGDASFDILMGKNAGLTTCAVSYGNGTLDSIKEVEPDYILSSIDQLLDLI